MKVLKSGSVHMCISVAALNKVMFQHKNRISISSLLFDTLVNVSLAMKSPVTVKKERLSVLLIARNQSQQIGDDAVRLISSFLYSHDKTLTVVSSTLEIINTVSSGRLISSPNLSQALITTFTNYRDKRILNQGCILPHYLTVFSGSRIVRHELLHAGICEVLIEI
jgi:hypothetical protein